MTSNETVTAAHRILDSSLDGLIDPSQASVGDSSVLAHWGLTAADQAVLATYGVPIERDPDGIQLVGAVQASKGPAHTANGRPAYRLGFHRWRTLVVVPDNAMVYAIPPERSDDPLSNRYVGDPPIRVNSSVRAFVETAWRWHRIRPILLAAGDDESLVDAMELLLDWLPMADPALSDASAWNWWRNLILNW